MDKYEYKKIVDDILPKKIKLRKLLIAFIVGGVVGLIGQLLITIYSKFEFINTNDACSYMMITLIFVSSVLTGIGVMDDLIEKVGAGLIIPITGFAHSTTSSAMEYKSEGVVTGIINNMLKLAGSIIVTGVISSFVVATILYFLGV